MTERKFSNKELIKHCEKGLDFIAPFLVEEEKGGGVHQQAEILRIAIEALSFSAVPKADYDNAERDAQIGLELSERLERQLREKQADYDKLAAECASMKAALNPQSVPDSVLDVFSDTATYDVYSCGPWSSQNINNTEQVILAALNAMPKPETPATDAAIAEFKAQGADAVLRELVTSDDDDFTDAPAICANVAARCRQSACGG